MKKNPLIAFVIFVSMLIACQAVTPLSTPSPMITAEKDKEFILAADQTATVTDAGITIHLIGVAGDERCPSEIECAVSGPVSVSLTVQTGSGVPTNMDLQTFTSMDGRSPGIQFQGINDRATYQGYSIQLMGVTPYPANRETQIKASDYRIILIVTPE